MSIPANKTELLEERPGAVARMEAKPRRK